MSEAILWLISTLGKKCLLYCVVTNFSSFKSRVIPQSNCYHQEGILYDHTAIQIYAGHVIRLYQHAVLWSNTGKQ